MCIDVASPKRESVSKDALQWAKVKAYWLACPDEAGWGTTSCGKRALRCKKPADNEMLEVPSAFLDRSVAYICNTS